MYWYIAKRKYGGVFLQALDKKYQDDDMPFLKRHYVWVTKPYASSDEASRDFARQIQAHKIPDPPTTITRLHKHHAIVMKVFKANPRIIKLTEAEKAKEEIRARKYAIIFRARQDRQKKRQLTRA